MPAAVIQINVSSNYLKDLKKRLKKDGITQYRLAKEMDVAESQVSRWFRLDMMPSLKNIERIERAILSLKKQQAKAKK